jgi:molybdopterin molybdotransferase
MRENHTREDYIRAHIDCGPDGRLKAVPFSTQDSAMLLTLANADGLIRRPPHAPPAAEGTIVDVIVFNHLGSPI